MFTSSRAKQLSGAPDRNVANTSQKYEQQCLNMKLMFCLVENKILKFLNICYEFESQSIEISLKLSMKSKK